MNSRWLSLGLAGALFVAPAAAHAKGKPLPVSSENFVSLSWSRSGGFAGISESYSIQNHEIARYSGRGSAPNDPPQVKPFSANQWKKLLAQLKATNIPAIAGTYKQPHLADGFNETLVLTLSDDADLDRTFVVSNYGDQAPAAYYKFTATLSRLIERKFPATR